MMTLFFICVLWYIIGLFIEFGLTYKINKHSSHRLKDTIDELCFYINGTLLAALFGPILFFIGKSACIMDELKIREKLEIERINHKQKRRLANRDVKIMYNLDAIADSYLKLNKIISVTFSEYLHKNNIKYFY